jgi:hypothetical protein
MSVRQFERFFKTAHKAQRVHADIMDEYDMESVASDAKRNGFAFTKDLTKQLQREMTPGFAPSGPAGPSGPTGMGNRGGGSSRAAPRTTRQQPPASDNNKNKDE